MNQQILKNIFKILCEDVKLITKRYAKFRVHNCNATDFNQEKPKGGGRIRPLPPRRSQVNTCKMLLYKPNFEHLSLFLTSIFCFYITSLFAMASTVNCKFVGSNQPAGKLITPLEC